MLVKHSRTLASSAKVPRLFLGVLVGSLLGSCQPRQGVEEVTQRMLLQESFEQASPSLAQAALTTEKAHTGKCAVQVSPAQPYVTVLQRELGQLATHRPRRFTLSAWMWVDNQDVDARLVTNITTPDNPAQPIFSQLLYPADDGRYKQWHFVKTDLDLPKDIHMQDVLTVYLWSANTTTPVYADDFQLTELW